MIDNSVIYTLIYILSSLILKLMGLDMYLEGSFSTRAYTQPTDQDYADMREGKKVTVER